MQGVFSGIAFVLAVIVIIRVWRRRGRLTVGPGAAGAVYELLNEDKRKAVEIIVEEKTGYRDPEDRDGNLPTLEKPTRGT